MCFIHLFLEIFCILYQVFDEIITKIVEEDKISRSIVRFSRIFYDKVLVPRHRRGRWQITGRRKSPKVQGGKETVVTPVTTHVENAVMSVELGSIITVQLESIMVALSTAMMDKNPNANCTLVAMPDRGGG